MIATLALYKRWFEIGAIALLILVLFLAVHSWSEKQREIGREEMREEYAEQLRVTKEASDKVEKFLRDRADDAIAKGNEREQTIRTLVSANSNASIGLRNATASIGNSLPSLSQDSLRNLASAYGNVLTECNARLGEMATNSERLNSEKMTLIQAWPTAPAEAK